MTGQGGRDSVQPVGGAGMVRQVKLGGSKGKSWTLRKILGARCSACYNNCLSKIFKHSSTMILI